MSVLVRETVLFPMAVVPIVPTVVPTTETCLLVPLNANLTWLPLNASFVCVPLNDESTRPAGVIFTYPLALVALVVNDTLGVYVVLADRDDTVCVCVPTLTMRPIWLAVAVRTLATSADGKLTL